MSQIIPLPTVSPGLVIGLIIIALGGGLLFIVVKAAGGGRVMRVPDGIPPDKYYRDWRDGRLGKKVSRTMVFIIGAAVAMMLSGCGVIVWGILK